MVPESFAPNDSINNCIYECLQYFEGADRAKIEGKLREDAGAEVKDTFLHTFRELIFGSYLARRGCRVRPYQVYGKQTPDWSAFGERGDLIALIDVMTFHPLEAVESEIRRNLDQGKPACPKIDLDKLSQKFFSRLKDKCTAYTELVRSRNVPYLVACFFTFDNWYDDATKRMIKDNLHSAASGFFRDKTGEGCYPDVSGLVTFYEDDVQFFPPDSVATIYVFDYDKNPHAVRPCGFPPSEYYPPMAINKRDYYKLCVQLGRKEIDKSEFHRLLQELRARPEFQSISIAWDSHETT